MNKPEKPTPKAEAIPDGYANNCLQYLDSAIISTQNLDKIKEITEFAGYSPFILFEIYLKPNIKRVDYSLGFPNQKAHKEAFHRLIRTNHQTLWGQRMSEFSTEWCDPDSVIGRCVSGVGLEFDAGSGDPSFSNPSFFFTLEKDQKQATESVSFFEGAQRVFTLLGVNLSTKTLGNLEKCYQVLNQYVPNICTGIWFSREGAFIRIAYSWNQHPLSEMYSALREVGWPGPSDAYESKWGQLLDEKTILSPALDVGDSISPDLKIEWRFAEPSFAEQNKRWQNFLDQLIGYDWCSPQKRDGILAWPGANRIKTARVSNTGTSIFQEEENVLVRSIRYLKFSFSSTKPTDVKMYLNAWSLRRDEEIRP